MCIFCSLRYGLKRNHEILIWWERCIIIVTNFIVYFYWIGDSFYWIQFMLLMFLSYEERYFHHMKGSFEIIRWKSIWNENDIKVGAESLGRRGEWEGETRSCFWRHRGVQWRVSWTWTCFFWLVCLKIVPSCSSLLQLVLYTKHEMYSTFVDSNNWFIDRYFHI